MTVSNLTNRVQFSGNGSTTIFSFSFKIFADTELVVTETVTATGVETTKNLSSHYTVQGAGNESGGTVTMGVAPASGTTLTIKRELALTQTTDFLANDAFSSESLESALDRLIMVSQQLDELDDRAINFPVSDAVGLTTILPTAVGRANKVLSFDASGNVITSQEIGTLKGNWAASTAYIIRDLVKDTATNNIFMCIVAHTSSGSQPLTSNTDAAKWSLIVDAASATTSATAAAASATAAAASAVDATTNGAAQVTLAAAQVALATTQATNSATSATASAASQVAAASSATGAASSATAAAASAAAAALSADNFDDLYLGAKSSDPATDNDGDALTAGDLYFNTSSNVMKVYTGSAWNTAAADTSTFVTSADAETTAISMAIALG